MLKSVWQDFFLQSNIGQFHHKFEYNLFAYFWILSQRFFLMLNTYHFPSFDALISFKSYIPQNSLSVTQFCEIWGTLSSFGSQSQQQCVQNVFMLIHHSQANFLSNMGIWNKKHTSEDANLAAINVENWPLFLWNALPHSGWLLKSRNIEISSIEFLE